MSRIDDGHQTLLEFSAATSGVTVFWEKEITPPGVSGNGENDTSTMRNAVYRTKAPKSLKTLTPGSFVVAYDPAILDEMIAMVQVNQQITITYPDLSTWVFWGFIDEFTPNALVEGEQPTANITVIPSNQDAAGDEIAPVYAAAP
jgi:hypothetical protein